MKTVNLGKGEVDLATVLDLAREGPVLLLAQDGREFLLSEADDFEREVETLRRSQRFQKFLEERAGTGRRVPLEEIELAIDEELAKEKP